MFQPKLRANAPGDFFEREADLAAEQVARSPGSDLFRDSASDQEPEDWQAAADHPYHALSGGGQPLSDDTRAYMEPRFGHNFGQVRVHDDAKAASVAQAVNARAFTIGRDLFFGPGEYQPSTSAGRTLIAHELAHTIQQSAMPDATIQRAEVDEAATGVNCATLPDGSAALNAEVNRRLAAARGATPTVPMAPGVYGPPGISGSHMVRQAFDRLGAPHNMFLALIENWSNTNLPHRGGGYTLGILSGTRYENLPLSHRGLYGYMAPVVKLNGVCVGTDKIGHMFQQGLQYLYISESGAMAGTMTGMGRGDRYARAWGEWMEGHLSPATRGDAALMTWLRTMSSGPAGPAGVGGQTQGHFGLAATGVHSRGDLAANEAGMRFYRDLLGNPYMTFDINRYVTRNWSEQVSGNIYSSAVGTAVRSAGRLGSHDVVLP